MDTRKHTREADRRYVGMFSHSEEEQTTRSARAKIWIADPHTWSLSKFSKAQISRSVIPTNQTEMEALDRRSGSPPSPPHRLAPSEWD